MNFEEFKAAQTKAVEGLTGKARAEGKKAFIEANKDAWDAARTAHYDAIEEQRLAPIKALQAAGAEKGMSIWIMANIGYFRGSSRDTAVLVRGHTFPFKDILKAHGAMWNPKEKCWIFNGMDACERALAAI